MSLRRAIRINNWFQFQINRIHKILNHGMSLLDRWEEKEAYREFPPETEVMVGISEAGCRCANKTGAWRIKRYSVETREWVLHRNDADGHINADMAFICLDTKIIRVWA